MAMITFEDLPSTDTPINAANLNNNFGETMPVNSYNTSTSKTYSCDYANKTYGGTVLWEQNYPSGDFPDGQTITLSSSDYSILEVWYVGFPNDNDTHIVKLPKGRSIRLWTFLSGGAIRMRNLVYVSDTSYTTSSATNTSNVIPYKIIGYK